MKLTKKDKTGLYILNENSKSIFFEQSVVEMIANLIQVIGKYEDLEEQLGCPVDIVFKALKNGVYYEDTTNYMIYLPVDLRIKLDGDYVLYYDDEEYLLTKNYKKTWWLKKDKSE